MGLIKGGAMRLTSTALYFVTFIAGALMTAFTAWVSIETHRELSTHDKATNTLAVYRQLPWLQA